MKENIDLTRNRMFPQRRNRETALWRVLTRIPWNLHHNLHHITSDIELTSERFNFYPTGNREEREQAQMWINENSGLYCDRCGRYVARIPWRGQYGLCQKCAETLFEPHHKQIPWKHSDKEEPDGNIFF